jgi:site-specific recombinase XerD
MSVLTFKSDDYKKFPSVLQNYASYSATIKGNSEKTVCEYLLDLRTFFRFLIMKRQGSDLTREEFENVINRLKNYLIAPTIEKTETAVASESMKQ